MVETKNLIHSRRMVAWAMGSFVLMMVGLVGIVVLTFDGFSLEMLFGSMMVVGVIFFILLLTYWLTFHDFKD